MTWILRTAAVVMLVLAFLPRGGASSTRTVLIAIEGARLDTVLTAVEAGELPALKSLVESGVYGIFSTAQATADPLADLVALARPAIAAGPRRTLFLWDRPAVDGTLRIVVGFGPGAPIRTASAIVLPGPDPQTGFVGSNTGRIENLTAMRKVMAPWPYTGLGDTLVERAAELEPGQASDWIEVAVPDDAGGRSGVFRLYRLDDDVAWLSPVFTRTLDGRVTPGFGALGESVYVPDSATWTVRSSRVHDYFYQHVLDVTASRAAAASALAGSKDWSLLMYVDDLPASVEYAYADEERSSATRVRERAYGVVDRRISDLLAVAGETVVVVIGIAPVGDVAGEGAANWYIVAGDRGQSLRIDSTAAELASTLRYLVGASGEGIFPAANPIHAVAARYWRRPQPRSTVAVAAPAAEMPLTVDSLKNLGALRPPDA